MWTTVYMTQNIDVAKAMRKKIEEKKIIAMLKTNKVEDNLGGDYFEILVPSAEIKEALDIIIE